MKTQSDTPDLSQAIKKCPSLEIQTPKSIPSFSEIIKNNRSGWILRSDLTEKTGGLLHGRTMANLDSLGQGIPGRIKIGSKKIAYPVKAVVEYLQKMVSVSDARQ